MFKKIHTAPLTRAKIVIPAKRVSEGADRGAGIQRNTGFPRVKHPVSSTGQAKAGLVIPGTTECLRLLLPLTIWSCHTWVAPAFRLYYGLAAAGSGVRGANRSSTPRTLEPLNSAGFTLIELIAVIIIVGILVAAVLPNNIFTTSSTVSSWGVAYMIASDIRYTQECAMASMVSKGISFTNNSFTSGQIAYTFPATTPSTSSLDPTGRLPSALPLAVQIGTPNSNPITFTFNSLGEPEETTSNSITVTVGGIMRTITVTQYTGMVSIS